MPHLRGIELSLVTDFGSRALCEYPHPDAASFRLLPQSKVEQDANGLCRWSSESISVSPKKSNPRVSVYVSSTPEDEFWLRYAIIHSQPPSRFIYFKMLINGRHIVSWGIDTTHRVDGTVAKALYQPSQKQTDDNGTEQPVNGVESRYFHFLPGLESQSAAEDGGLIEVRVFRCRERQRIEAELEEHRGQEQYGISSPSGGLLQRPEDTFFYEYHLMDARDSPYATFCFHYRSMKYLKQLNLLPSQEVLSGRLSPVKPTKSAQRHPGALATTSHPSSRKYRDSLDLATSPTPQDRRSDATISWSVNGNVNSAIATCDGTTDSHTPPAPGPDVRPSSRDCDAAARTEISRDEYLESSHRRWSVSRKSSRSSSLRSNCPSLTASLKQYAESIEFQNEDVRLSMAHPFPVSSESLAGLCTTDDGARSSEDTVTSDYASSSSTSGLSAAEQCPSPSTYLPTTGSTLEKHIMDAFQTSPAQGSPAGNRGIVNRTHGVHGAEHDGMKAPRDATEAQWLQDSSPYGARSPTGLELQNDNQSDKYYTGIAQLGFHQLRVTANPPDGRHGSDRRAVSSLKRDGSVGAPVGNWI